MSDALRTLIAEANRAIERAGLVTLSFGNASGVDRDAGILLIKPSGIPCGSTEPQDLIGIALDDGHIVEGTGRPSTDTPTHRLLYREFPEIGGIVHSHSSFATSWAQSGRAIPALGTTHADYFRGPVLVSRPLDPGEIEGEYESETGRAIAETARGHGRTPEDSPAVLVASHGPFTWGPSPAAAVEVAVALEAIAAMASQTLLIDPTREAISPELLARHFDRKHGRAAYYGQGGPTG